MLNIQLIILHQVFTPLSFAGLLPQQADEINANDIQSIFYQVIALLGLSLAAYLYINLRNNKSNKNRLKSSFSIKNDARRISDNLQQLVNLIPYAACISDEKLKVIYSNTAYKTLVKSLNTNRFSKWDKQLGINFKKHDLTDSHRLNILNDVGRKLKLTIKPIEL